MTRLRRFCPIGHPVHLIQRGNNRTDCFFSEFDKATYIRYLLEASRQYEVDVHAWVLMSNHVHLLITPRRDEAVSRMIQHLGSRYVRYFNKKYSRTGTLWEGRFRSCLIQSEKYFLTCQRYIELNPVRAGIVESPADFHWSSYHSNALGIESGICNPHPVYLALGPNKSCRLRAYRSLFAEAVSGELIKKIRFSVNKGLVLGSEGFISQIETLSGQRGRLMKTGPRGPHRK